MDHYELLGVSRTATDDEIKAAGRKRSRETHPDHGGSPEAFRAVTEAWDTLRDRDRRAAYDAMLAAAGRPTFTFPHARRERNVRDLFDFKLFPDKDPKE